MEGRTAQHALAFAATVAGDGLPTLTARSRARWARTLEMPGRPNRRSPLAATLEMPASAGPTAHDDQTIK